MHERDTRQAHRPDVLLATLIAGCIVVPAVFTTRLQATFVVPKLAVLWSLLAVSLGVIAVAGLRSRAPRPAPVRLGPVDVAVATFVALTFAAWLFSSDRRQSLYGERLQHQGLLTLLLYVGFFYVARASVSDGRRLKWLLSATVLGSSLVAGYALVQKAGLDPIWNGHVPGGRVFSSIGQANALAAYLVLTIPLAAGLAVGASRLIRTATLAAAAAMLLALVFTQSRGGFLGLGAAFVVLAFVSRRDPRPCTRPLAAAAIVAVVAAGLLAVVHPSPASDALRHATSTSDASVRFHLDAWRVASEMVKDHPLLGTGPETFPELFPTYSHRVLPPDRAAALDAFRVESPHNVYLAIAAGSGIPALAAYLALVACFFLVVVRAARRVERKRQLVLFAVLAASAGHLVTDAFMTADVTTTWLFWVLMGATLASIGRAGEDPVRQPGLHQHSATTRIATPRRST